MGGRNETEHNGYTQPLLNGVEAAQPEETELANCLVLSRPIYQDTGKKKAWTVTVHAQPSIFQTDTDVELLASAHSELAALSQRKSLKPGDRVVLTGIVTSQTITFPNGETRTINRIALTHAPHITAKEKRVSTTIFEQHRRR
jgi:hypothetical protein